VTGLGVLLFVAFLLIAIGLHEAGHFATAKAFGIKVERFFIGFGPRLWSTRRGETEYGISLLPFGGYVRIAGMNPLEEVAPEDRPRAFKAKPAWQRAIVLAAGSVTHFLVALAIIAAILATAGEPDVDRPTLVIAAVGATRPGEIAPAVQAGLRPGDRIVSVDGVPATGWRQVVELIHARAHRTVEIVVERDGRLVTTRATLAEVERDGRRVGFLGVSPEFEVVRRSAPAAVAAASKEVVVGMRDSLLALRDVFSPETLARLGRQLAGQEPRRPEDPATVVGIGRTSGDLARRGDFVGLFLLVAGFNVFVGVANLLPLPPLDGGHLAVLAVEKLTRREVDMRRLVPITATVLTLFGTLFVMLLYLDIVRPLPSLPG
jgi:membrane-associated protease RseP (regulator of RpoE activity)